MILKKNEHLKNLARVRVPQSDTHTGVLRLNRNEKPDDWPDDLLEKIFGSVPNNILQRYPDVDPLYSKLAEFVGVETDSILLTSGIDEAIKNIISLYCDTGDTFAVTWPGYAMYDVYADILGCELAPIIYNPDDFTTPEKLCEQLPEGIKILFLPNPSQPVENCFDLNDLRQIAKYCKEKNIILAMDEAYHFFGAATAVPLISEFSNIMVMRSFSKGFGGAGLRLGYLIADPETLAPFSAARLAYEVNALTVHVGCILLDSYESHIKPSIDLVCEGRTLLRRRSAEIGIPSWGDVSNNVLMDLGSSERMLAAAKGLQDQFIYVKSNFPAPLDRHIMVTCGPPDMMDRFFDALNSILS